MTFCLLLTSLLAQSHRSLALLAYKCVGRMMLFQGRIVCQEMSRSVLQMDSFHCCKPDGFGAPTLVLAHDCPCRTQACINMHTHTHAAHALIRASTQAYAHVHTRTHTQTHTHRHTRTHTHTHTYTHAQTHTQTYMQARTHPRTIRVANHAHFLVCFIQLINPL